MTIQSTPLGNRDLMRAMNRSIILNVIKTHGPIARAEVARLTGLSPATVTGITANLIEEDLIFEKEPGNSSGGRPPILLRINPTGGFVVGVKLTETELIGALTDLDAKLLARQADRLIDQNAAQVVTSLATLVDELIEQAALPREKLLGVGVGLAGIVDFQRGVLRRSPFLDWTEMPLQEMLRERLQVPVYVDNDVNTLTQAEKWFGSGQGVNNFLVITVGRGVGMGIVINGQFYRGAGGGAGEFGHIIVQSGGRSCACGRRGCLETLVSEPGILRSAQTAAEEGRLPRVETLEDLLQLAQEGNATARKLLAEAGEVLGLAIANLVNVFNPHKIILGGEGVRLGAHFFEPLQQTVKQNASDPLIDDLTVQIEPWGDDAWARGAASLVLRELFESPVHREARANAV